MPRTIITGGAGFIGSSLCRMFIEKGHEVVCLDNLSTGSLSNIESLIENENFQFIKYDVTEYIYVKGRVDYILHFASPASPADYHNLPIQTLKVGSLGTHKVLGLAKEKKARFLLASTSEVYGDPLVHPQPENYWGNVNPVGPRGVYDEAKRFAEALVMAYNRVHNVETRIIRIFNTYGPFMRINDGRAIPNFIAQALRGEDITIYGDGNQTRSFCYISDMVEGIHRALLSEHVMPINIGNPVELSVLDMANTILSLTNSKSKVVFKTLPEDDPKIRQPDITLAKKILEWEPTVDVGLGLERTIDGFRERMGANKSGKC